MISSRRSVSGSSLGAVLVFALVSSAANARADDPTKEQCIAANEGAQSLRQTGKLQAARAQLLVCIAKTCPGPIRDDCAERLNDLERATPTVVFTAKGTASADLSAVKVTMDGVMLADHLDGAALSVEPGKHVFEFTTEGYPSVSKELFVREGVKGRQEVVAFAPQGAGAGPTPVVVPIDPSTTPTSTPSDAPPAEPSGSGLKTWAFVAGGVGVVGLGLGTYFGLRASSKWSSAKDACVIDRCGPSSDAQKDKDDASSAGTISTIAFVVGGAALVTGVTLLVLSPSSKGTSSARLRVVPGLGSLAAVGAF